MLFHVGIDDTDSKEGMCTTYVGAKILEELSEIGIEPAEHPHLIRLNPNWKGKTRGNCAISFVLDIDKHQTPKVKKIALEKVEELAELHIKETTPGVAFYSGSEIPDELKSHSKDVVQEVVAIEKAEKLAKKINAEIHKFRAGRGIIGALAAIGHPLKEDYTYELIAYRKKENRGTPRRIDEESVRRMNKATSPKTFDNIDSETGEIQINPHTPCPILYGIRSEDQETAFEAQKMVKEEEPVELTQLYKTNQGTDEHLQPAKVEDIEPYESVIVEGVISDKPETRRGGHVFFSLKDETEEINCAAFEPTQRFRKVIRKLVPGDKIKVYGGVKEKQFPLTINLEKIDILDLKPVKRKENPTCENCGKKMTSAGTEKGYLCRDCGIKLPPKAGREVEVERDLETGIHEVPPSARRHLAKPLMRIH